MKAGPERRKQRPGRLMEDVTEAHPRPATYAYPEVVNDD
jgi:hypothetical protein